MMRRAAPPAAAVLLSSAALSTAAANATLRGAAQQRGIFVGAAMKVGPANSDAEYAAVLGEQYSMVTADIGCKWGGTQPRRGEYTFEVCDGVLDFARRHRMAFRGHNLCWGVHNPDWLASGNFSGGELRGILEEHITKVAGHYGTDAYAWDVVNEAVSEHPGKDTVLKNNVWYPAVPDYLEVAFNTTRKVVGPDVKLFYNDYDIAEAGAKANAVYDLVKSLRQRGVPVDGVGFQCHISADWHHFGDLEKNIARFGALGVEVHITELDVKTDCKGCTLQHQANVYQRVLEACMSQPACKVFDTWGFTDKYTWIGTSQEPLPFDVNYKPKPAYAALLHALQANNSIPRVDRSPR